MITVRLLDEDRPPQIFHRTFRSNTTHFGLDLGEDIALSNLRRVLEEGERR